MKKNGYSLLNKGKTGKYSGSIGLHFKWNKETSIEESKKYHSRSEFKKNNRSAFDYIYKHNMLDEIAHLNGWK